MRIDMNTPVSVLIHGENINYIELDEGELCHWKYIKREKLSNGKYRYYYDESELTNAKKEVDSLYNKSVVAAIDVYNAKQELSKTNGLDKKKLQKKLKKVDYTIRAHSSYLNEAQAAEKKYQTKKITSFLARTISKGFVKIANLLFG